MIVISESDSDSNVRLDGFDSEWWRDGESNDDAFFGPPVGSS